jgi:hypothetical protein
MCSRPPPGRQRSPATLPRLRRGVTGTGAAAGQMLGAASELSRQAEMLQGHMDSFLTVVRAA